MKSDVKFEDKKNAFCQKRKLKVSFDAFFFLGGGWEEVENPIPRKKVPKTLK